MNALLTFLFATLPLLSLPPEKEPPNPPEEVELEVKLRLEKAGSLWRFVVEGKTDLPEGTVLRARLFVVDERTSDEEPVVHPFNECGDDPWQDWKVEKGTFGGMLNEFSRKPFSLPYRVRVSRFPGMQSRGIPEPAGGGTFGSFGGLRLGSEEEFRRELEEVKVELGRDLRTVYRLFQEVRDRAGKVVCGEGPSGDGEWFRTLEDLERRNRKRYGFWKAWLERQGKGHLKTLGNSLRRISGEVRLLQTGDGNARGRLLREERFFVWAFGRAVHLLGFDMPLDPDAANRAFRGYREASIRLERLAGEGREGRERAEADLLKEARQSLVNLVPHLPVLGYRRIVELEGRLRMLVKGLRQGGVGSALAEARAARVRFEAYLSE